MYQLKITSKRANTGKGNVLLELGGPVESTSSSGGGTGVVHVVHTVLADQWEQRLGSLLNGLVESLRGGVTVLSEDLVLGRKLAADHSSFNTEIGTYLGKEHSLDTSHKLQSQ